MASIAEVCSSTEYYLMFFARLNESNKKDKKGGKQSWVAPPPDYYKTHCDASLCSDFKKGGWGFIARNCRELLEGGAGNLKKVSSPLHAEALATYWSLRRAAELGMTKVILETDAAILADALKSRSMD